MYIIIIIIIVQFDFFYTSHNKVSILHGNVDILIIKEQTLQ